MISTDKAVRPTSVMGATKRVAELLVRSLATSNGSHNHANRFASVSGNGREPRQCGADISAADRCRRPVTITHEEMTRYFSHPEAVQLVMQASTQIEWDHFTLWILATRCESPIWRKLIEMSG